MMNLSNQEILLRICLICVISIFFGLQRHHTNKPVGVRTHVLIGLSTCIIAMISAYGFQDLATTYPDNVTVNTDPARLMVGVLTGIGFLGAGAIWKSDTGDIHGITTAANIFMLAALGIACGLGLYFLLTISFVIAFVFLAAEDWLERIRQKKRGTAVESAGDSQLDDKSL